MLKYTANATAR